MSLLIKDLKKKLKECLQKAIKAKIEKDNYTFLLMQGKIDAFEYTLSQLNLTGVE